MPNRSDSSSPPPSRGAIPACKASNLASQKSANRAPYRVLDCVLMLACALPALAIMSLIAIGQWIQFGQPRLIFFRQRRVGRAGRVFTLVKFRTMSEPVDRSGQALSDAQRVTRFGKFLRNTHLDELPQLWNILCGEMSFIGPRPEMESIHSWACERIEGFEARLAVRPGITGLAQTTQGYTGLDESAYREKLRLDLEFIHSQTPFFQTRILLRTAVWMIRGKGWRWEGSSEAQSADSNRGPSHATIPAGSEAPAENPSRADSNREDRQAA